MTILTTYFGCIYIETGTVAGKLFVSEGGEKEKIFRYFLKYFDDKGKDDMQAGFAVYDEAIYQKTMRGNG